MESDPLNDIANAFSKVSEDETAVFQVIVHPIPDSEWRKNAEKKADLYFKNKKDNRIFT